MHNKLSMILTSLCVSPAFVFSAMKQQPKQAAPEKPTMCDETSPRTQRIEVKHIEAKGVGYRQGYSTLEGFFTVPSTLDGSWVPFLDIRGHIFNDGKPAVNGGMGLRYLTDTRVWGLNTYYDYRKTHKTHFNQVGFGFETLGKIWDFRLNAYVPVGKKDSHIFNTHFHEFKHHSIILSSKKEIAMKGANAEAAAHVLRKENYKLYVGAGPYYFEHEGRVAWGGEGRIALTLFDYLRLQVSGSGDKVFHGIVQGEAALVFSFGGKRSIKPRKNNNDCYCAERAMVEERALQRVDRNEMIVVTKKQHKAKAVNPVTGDPYKVWFVDNTSHSQGTFESPFNNLLLAQLASEPHDIIYVFPGDGTDNGMNAGIVLQKGQQLLGAGIGQQVETTKGLINIRAHAKGLPMISNTLIPLMQSTSHAAVLMSQGNNVVSGFLLVDNIGGGSNPNFSDLGAAIQINDGLNYLIKNNICSVFTNFNTPVPGSNAVSICGGGHVTAADNIFLCRDAQLSLGVSMFNVVSPLQGTYTFENNLITGVNSSSGFNEGIFVPIFNTGLKGTIGNITVNVINNTLTSQHNVGGTPTGIFVDSSPSTSTIAKANIIGNTVEIPAGLIGATSGIQVQGGGPGLTIANLHKNVSLTISPTPGYLFVNLANLQVDFGSDNEGTRVGP